MAFSEMKAHAYALTNEKLFAGGSDDDQVLFKIPDYQRPYVWKKGSWEALFGDIIENGLLNFENMFYCRYLWILYYDNFVKLIYY